MEFFPSTGQLSDTGKYLITEIVLNSIPISYNYTDGSGRTHNAGYVMTSSHATTKMKKRDKVWIRTHHNYICICIKLISIPDIQLRVCQLRSYICSLCISRHAI